LLGCWFWLRSSLWAGLSFPCV